MDQQDKDTITRSLVNLPRVLDLNQRFLSILQSLEHRVFSEQMIEDILVTELFFVYMFDFEL